MGLEGYNDGVSIIQGFVVIGDLAGLLDDIVFTPCIK